jgi:outer membrane lipoprotein-sorting protein
MWKKISFLCVAVLSIASLHGQTVDEILAKYYENAGSYEQWKALTSQKMIGTMSMGPMDFKGTVYSKPPNKQKVIVDIQGTELIQAYDGETAWMYFPLQMGPDPQIMPADQAEQFTSQEFEMPFMDYKEKGNTLELEGKEEVEGAEAFKIKLTKKDGKVQYYYFDAEHYVPIMMKEAIMSGPTKGQDAETFLSDYQEVDGLMIPFFIEVKVGGQTAQKISIESMVFNEEMKDEIFAMPKKAKEAPASGN